MGNELAVAKGNSASPANGGTVTPLGNSATPAPDSTFAPGMLSAAGVGTGNMARQEAQVSLGAQTPSGSAPSNPSGTVTALDAYNKGAATMNRQESQLQIGEAGNAGVGATGTGNGAVGTGAPEQSRSISGQGVLGAMTNFAMERQEGSFVGNATTNLVDSAHELYQAFNRRFGRNDVNKISEILSEVSPENMPALNAEFRRELAAHGKKVENLDTYMADELGLDHNNRLQRKIGFNPSIAAKALHTALNDNQPEMVLAILRDRTPDQMKEISAAFVLQDKKPKTITQRATEYYAKLDRQDPPSPHKHDLDQVLQLVNGTSPSRVAENVLEALHDKDVKRFTRALTDGNGHPLPSTEYAAVDAAVRAKSEQAQGIQELANQRFKGEKLERADMAINACQTNAGALASQTEQTRPVSDAPSGLTADVTPIGAPSTHVVSKGEWPLQIARRYLKGVTGHMPTNVEAYRYMETIAKANAETHPGFNKGKLSENASPLIIPDPYVAGILKRPETPVAAVPE